MIVIDGERFNIPIKEFKRKAEFLDKYARRTEDGVLQRELIGVYFNYSLVLGKSIDTKEYNRMWEKLTEPVEFHTVTIPDDDGSYTFTAYFSNVGDQLKRVIDGQCYYQGLTVNFIAKSPARSG